MAGTVVPTGGDLKVTVARAPGAITQKKQDHEDWSIQLAPVDGAIMETDPHTAQVTFEAPSEGYQKDYLAQMSRDMLGWFDNISKTFFMTSRSGHIYSKFSLDFEINDDPNGTMWFQFKGVANTNASRNWEATIPK